MAKVQINSWEDGEMEGTFDTVEEAEAYVLEEEMDVVVYDFSGSLLNATGYRFNTEIAAKRDTKEHPALTHMKKLYPDFLTSLNYRFRVTIYVNGIMYESSIPMTSAVLVEALRNAPEGLHAIEFMLAKDDPNRGLAWKLLWSER